MGLFDRFRGADEEPWAPPQPGSCACEEHVEALREGLLSRATDSGDVTVGALLDNGSLAVSLVEPEPTYVTLPVTGQRVGPFHWTLTIDGEARDLYRPGAPAALDDCVSVQPGVDRVAWPTPEVMLVGAPTLCGSGVLAALVRALENPRLRLQPGTPEA